MKPTPPELDRSTELAVDRTVLAAERTYAAWIRTGLAFLAGGVGGKALLASIRPHWLGGASGTVLILFSIFCFAVAVWREIKSDSLSLRSEERRLPRWAPIVVSGLLMLVDAAALAGVWAGG